MAKFKVGDTVRLNSSSNLMTVESLIPPDRVRCDWHDDASKPHQKTYNENELSHDDGVPPMPLVG